MADRNKCSHLKIDDRFSNLDHKGDTLSTLWNLQKNIQENIYGYNFETIRENLGDLKDFVNWNEEAIRDEFRELAEALGGVNSHGSAIWKPWKKNHREARRKEFTELTPEELMELKFEWIDLMHFMFNIAIAIDLTPNEIYNMYFAKNQENINRQENGY
jgi:hypothetical protein